MGSVEQITDYSALNTNPYWIEFLSDSNAKGFLEAFDTQFNDLEASAHSMFLEVWIADAIGEQLDVLGKIVGLDRNDRTDTVYRSLLLVKAEINTGSGEPETVIKLAKELYGATSVLYTPDYPAKFTLTHNGALDFFIQSTAVFENDDEWLLENGDNLIFQTEDAEAKNLVFSSIPAGVGITIITTP